MRAPISFICNFRKISCQIIGFQGLVPLSHLLKSWIRLCRDINNFSDRSRISQMRVPTPSKIPSQMWGHQPIVLAIFPKNCMKLKKLGRKGVLFYRFLCKEKQFFLSHANSEWKSANTATETDVFRDHNLSLKVWVSAPAARDIFPCTKNLIVNFHSKFETKY